MKILLLQEHLDTGQGSSTSQQPQGMDSELTEHQKQMVEEVLKRAEQSRHEARVVLDGSRLRQLAAMQRGSVDEQFVVFQENSFENDQHLVQMDSIPETMSVIPEDLPTSSRASISSERSPAKTVDEKPSELEEQEQEQNPVDTITTTITQKVKLISTHISQWLHSLDYEQDYYIPTKRSSKAGPLEVNELTEAYIDSLAEGIIIAACLQYAQQQLANAPYFRQYCEQLASGIIQFVYRVIEQQQSTEYVASEDVSFTKFMVDSFFFFF
ncbi:hypothetical protein WR25_06920 [Diploscapter pachys]|uniref:Uncharacterized protein n=1 Tax=Diploscapter pachys TaxID=2018661 RepID=A0A2A2KYY4_9BILA|nr:hypothetical protein WR25_06920 [Diploscapter pachys]